MPDMNEITNKFNKIVEEISSETSRLLREKFSSVQKTIEEAVKSSHVVSVPTTTTCDLAELKEASYSLRNAQGQAEIISAILNFAGKCVQRSAVFAFKNKKFYGWQAIGLKADSPSSVVAIKNIVVDGASPSPFADIAENGKPYSGKPPQNPVMEKLFSAFGGPAPREICLFPLMIKDRIIAVLYGDNITQSQTLFQTDSMEVMSVTASLVMEIVSLQRTKGAGLGDQKESGGEEGATRPVIAAPLPEEMDDATRKLHEKAKRTARVIVGDIALYNKPKIEQGLKSGKLGDLLRDDIMKGRELYHQRVAPEITRSTNYFEDTLIDMIAKGNRKALGL